MHFCKRNPTVGWPKANSMPIASDSKEFHRQGSKRLESRQAAPLSTQNNRESGPALLGSAQQNGAQRRHIEQPGFRATKTHGHGSYVCRPETATIARLHLAAAKNGLEYRNNVNIRQLAMRLFDLDLSDLTPRIRHTQHH